MNASIRHCFLFFLLGVISPALFSAHVLGANQYSSQNRLGQCGDFSHKNFQLIGNVQGSGFISPFLKQWVVIEGVVTLSLQGRDQYRGFWLQQSGRTKISESFSQGIFVYHGSKPVKVGQVIRLFAQVAEYKGLTEVKKVRSIKICSEGNTLRKAEPLLLPVSALIDLEAKEGMRVSLSQELVISDLYGAGYGLGNYGQFAVSSKLLVQPTELYTAAQLRQGKFNNRALKERDFLLIDDGSSKAYPNPIPFGFSADNPIRVGDRIGRITGILHAYGDHYMIIPEDVSAISIESSSPRTKTPNVSNDSNLIIASMNLGNYFNGAVEEEGKGAQKNKNFPTLRGARSHAGFLLQTEKTVSALAAMDADVIALMEVENNGYGKHSAIKYLTHALNKKFNNERHYRYVKPVLSELSQGKLGHDVISVGILYRPKKVILQGVARVLDSRTASKAAFDDKRNRPSLIQQFSFKNKRFIVAVNHFKSKGRPCDEVEVDDLQGNCNKTRYRAALALIDFINKEPLPTLILGDLNSYSQEEPLLALYDAGFINLKYHYDSKLPSFSYSFQGLLGNLDHALANSELLPFIKSVDSWHINSVEDVLLDYNKEDNGHKHPSIDTYGEPDMYRSSDHDPVVLGLQFPDI
ncbi:MAG: ExeM/NucH family extracellular endonuclease [Oleispira sp.]